MKSPFSEVPYLGYATLEIRLFGYQGGGMVRQGKQAASLVFPKCLAPSSELLFLCLQD